MNAAVASVIAAGVMSTAPERTVVTAESVHPDRYEPTFTHAIAHQFPRCDASTHNLRDKLVMRLDGTVHVMTFDAALALTERTDAWVLGSC